MDTERAPLHRSTIIATGAWLGAAQAALGLAVLLAVGASALVYFAVLAAWIGGGAVSAWTARSAGDVALQDAVRLGGVLFALIATRVVVGVAPFGPASFVAALACSALAGSYAGWFIAARGSVAEDRRAFLLSENNGFVLGFAAASLLLFVSPRAVDGMIAGFGALLLVARLRARRA